MKAVVFHEHGGPEVLRYEDRPIPSIQPHEVLIRVKACALNHLDIWVRQGIAAYAVPLPHIPGSDIAGIIEKVGDHASGVKVGDRVIVLPGLSCWRCDYCLSGRDNVCASYKIVGAQIDGGYAEYVAVPAVNAIALSAGLTFEQAAAFPLVTLTAWHMILPLADLKPGEDVLIMGAGSGVGSMAIQIAKMVGARVVTTVGDDEKIPQARSLGADQVINHAKEDVAKRVKAWTEGRGVHVVIDHIGQDVWDSCVASLAKAGRLVTCGATTGGEVRLDLRQVFSRQLTIRGSYLGTRAELVQAARLVGQGTLKPVVDRVYPLAEARAAQERMLQRKLFGKLVLSIT